MSPHASTAPDRPEVPKVVVTGATGAVGRHVARLLSELAGVLPTLLVRDTAKAAALGLSGTVSQGDYRDRNSLRAAFHGADTVFIVTANPLRPQDDESILAAASQAGVRHAVKLSWLGVADPGADDLVADWNRRSERVLHESGIPWTVLRIRTPMSNTLAWAPSIREHATVQAFGGGARTACVDPRDVAQAAVQILTEPTPHAGATYSLTGPQELSARSQAALLSQALGKQLTFIDLTADQARARWADRYGEQIADALLEGARRRAQGASARIDPTLEKLIGRPPATFAAWASDHTRHFS
ncbi:NAD(P)H-binding protein [Streptomyces indicus]|uniref:Uncharacterized conserved protein YbjT, contains NAD(P)-binding and DUF2867 domains n=1 Tax=Streptomyces indicus TaxID=417292 RepID=A0A1G9HNX7_9ACTN|nr:NAD(P)H-binding protein [Streptomyces indicus]SDL14223.1 Uncharacterized conserved protein YbjT, contains NAD(P)-binding and DUF2867 domains [Streptomyces indicus]